MSSACRLVRVVKVCGQGMHYPPALILVGSVQLPNGAVMVAVVEILAE